MTPTDRRRQIEAWTELWDQNHPWESKPMQETYRGYTVKLQNENTNDPTRPDAIRTWIVGLHDTWGNSHKSYASALREAKLEIDLTFQRTADQQALALANERCERLARAAQGALALLEGLAEDEERQGRRNAAQNVREAVMNLHTALE